MTLRVSALPCVSLLLLGCARGGETSDPKSATTGSSGRESSAAAEVGAPGTPWEEKSHQEKLEFMGHTVYPEMKKLFSAHEPGAEFRCQTCHGNDMEQVRFKMPNALLALPKDDPIQGAMDLDADTAQFMMSSVVPTMTKLLGVEPYDPKTGKGFGCFNCHQAE